MPISSYSNISSYFENNHLIFHLDALTILTAFLPPTGFHWNTNDLAITMGLHCPFFYAVKTHIKFFGIMTISIILAMTASRAVFLGFILLFCVYLILVKKKIFTLILIWFLHSLIFFTISQAKESENPRINELVGSIEALSLYLRGCRYWWLF